MSIVQVVNKKYRILTDATQRIWSQLSFWSKAEDTEFNSGKNLETTCGSIYGITDSLTTANSNYAASAKAVSTLNTSLQKFVGRIDYSNVETLLRTTSWTTSQLTATATKDGVILGNIQTDNASTTNFYINDNHIFQIYSGYNTIHPIPLLPINKGDVVKIDQSGGKYNCTVKLFGYES